MSRVDISALLWVFAAMWLLAIPLRWVAALILSMAIHEAAHIAAMRALDRSMGRVKISVRGIEIQTRFDHPSQELLCALAGPAASLLGVCMIKWFPRFALCCLFHGLYNLLPIGQQDGARILRSALTMAVGEQKALTYVGTAEWVLLGCLTAAGLAAVFLWRMGCWPLLAVIFLWNIMQKGKIPCKELQERVQ